MSMPQASAKKGTPPKEHTVSTMSRVPFFWHSSPTPSRFWYTPVLLSPCNPQQLITTVQILIDTQQNDNHLQNLTERMAECKQVLPGHKEDVVGFSTQSTIK